LGQIWFTADQHFGHKNIIDFCKRPFSDIEVMDIILADYWNNRVKPDDIVYHLGDFAIPQGSMREVYWHSIATYVSRLNGYKILIRGNHDKSHRQMREAGFIDSVDQAYITVEGTHLWLAHVPSQGDYKDRTLQRPRNAGIPYDIGLCGHVHNQWWKRDRMVNVGCDVWDYMPITIREIKERLEA
jgi:calcineurin-like phosphoesterase family protein